MAGKHIVKSFDRELERLKHGIVQMANGCLNQLSGAVEALKRKDGDLARKVVADDEKVDELQNQVDRMTIDLLAMRQPLAKDLRIIVGSLKIASDLERVADYAANVAKYIHYLNGKPHEEPVHKILQMAEQASTMMRWAIEAFNELDTEKSIALWKNDAVIDRHYEELLSQLQKMAAGKLENAQAPTALLFMGRCCERIGDHIKNVAEQIYYIATGSAHIMEKFGHDC